MSVFQLTTSRGGRRPGNRQRAPHTYFNSQPHEEVDGQLLCDLVCRYISTHDLTRRSTEKQYAPEEAWDISTHGLLTRRSTHSSDAARHVVRYFNSRPHEEVDPFSLMQLGRNSISTHDLTRRSTRFAPFACENVRKYFNSRPHEEVDRERLIEHVFERYFNSRPHEEVDSSYKPISQRLHISTHDLTRRSTSLKNCTASNTLFQLTTSRGGRPLRHNPGPKFLSISTHDLTRRSTGRNRSRRSRKEIFQLTTSQGGRLHRLSDRLLLHYFNSRPRKEVDATFKSQEFGNVWYFNSRPRKEVDTYPL